jgi:class 3 adenylate cyclase
MSRDERFVRYVPRFLLERLALDPRAPEPGWSAELSGAFLFADITGFTALAEDFASAGREGAEELGRLLNRAFGEMIATAEGWGGQVLQFGGDALSLAFPEGPGRRPIPAALACSLHMQRSLRSLQGLPTSRGPLRLEMGVGMSSGTARMLLLGRRELGLHCVVLGRAVAQAAAAERLSLPWRTTAAREALEALGPLLEPQGSGPFETVSVPGSLEWLECFRPPSPGPELRVAEGIVPGLFTRDVRARLQGSLPAGQHRRVTALFVGFDGLELEDDPELLPKLQVHIAGVQALCEQYGARLVQTVADPKECSLFIVLGAPVAHEQSEERAVLLAMELQQLARRHRFVLSQRAAAASGYVFAGDIGGPDRREYTVIGNVVNLAARLKEAAEPWSVLVDRYTLERVSSVLPFEPRPPLPVRGIRVPVQTYRLSGDAPTFGRLSRRGVPPAERPLIGRQFELQEIERSLGQAERGAGQALVLLGDAGLGKTRLAEELVRLARSRGWRTASGSGQPWAGSVAYRPFRSVFRQLLNIPAVMSLHKLVRCVAAALRHLHPALVAQLGTYEVVFAGRLAEEPASEPLDEARVLGAMGRLLECLCQETPTLLVLDDLHLCDGPSVRLFQALATRAPRLPLLLVGLARPRKGARALPWLARGTASEVQVRQLEELDPGTSLALARQVLGRELEAELRELVLSRGQGNPLFIEELCRFAADGLAGDLPGSLEELIIARFDALVEIEQQLLQAASVAGPSFELALIEALHGRGADAEALRQAAQALCQSGLLVPSPAEGPRHYRFSNALIRQAIYQSLLFARRRELQAKAAAYFEDQSRREALEEVVAGSGLGQ